MRLRKIWIFSLLLLPLILSACGGSSLSTEEARVLLLKFQQAQAHYREHDQAIVVVRLPNNECQVFQNNVLGTPTTPVEKFARMIIPVTPPQTTVTFNILCGDKIQDIPQHLQPGQFSGLEMSIIDNHLYSKQVVYSSNDRDILEYREWFEWSLNVVEDVPAGR